jgi:hypothetical protein
MYYIVEMQFPNGNTVTLTVVAHSDGDAVNKSRQVYPAATSFKVLGSHGA